MLPKKIRLTTALFDQVFKTGRVSHSERFWLRSFLLPSESPSRFSVAVPKKVAATAVSRNKIKRLVYRAIEMVQKEQATDLIGKASIFGLKKDISAVPFEEVLQEVRFLLLPSLEKPSILKKGLK